jgi:hypothetical protein
MSKAINRGKNVTTININIESVLKDAAGRRGQVGQVFRAFLIEGLKSKV